MLIRKNDYAVAEASGTVLTALLLQFIFTVDHCKYIFVMAPFPVQAMKANFERELVSRDEASEEKRRQILKQLRELEQEIEDERKQRSSAVAAKKKIEGDYQELEMMLEGASNAKEDLLKQNKKLQNALKDYQVTYWRDLSLV